MCVFEPGCWCRCGRRCCLHFGAWVLVLLPDVWLPRCALEAGAAAGCRSRVLRHVFDPVRFEARVLAPLEGAAGCPCGVRLQGAAHRNLLAIWCLCWHSFCRHWRDSTAGSRAHQEVAHGRVHHNAIGTIVGDSPSVVKQCQTRAKGWAKIQGRFGPAKS